MFRSKAIQQTECKFHRAITIGVSLVWKTRVKNQKRATKQRGFRVSERFQERSHKDSQEFFSLEGCGHLQKQKGRERKRVQMGKCDIFCFQQITFEMLVVYPAAEPVVKKWKYMLAFREEIIRAVCR